MATGPGKDRRVVAVSVAMAGVGWLWRWLCLHVDAMKVTR
jgi:hypothetical protein